MTRPAPHITAPARAPRRRRGFTLMELMVVIAIILVVVAVTVPAYSRIISSTNYAAAVNTVAATLARARALATERGERTAVAFLFDAETERYTLQVLATPINDKSGYLAPPGGPTGLTQTLTNIYWPADGEQPVTLPRGTAVFGLTFMHVDDRVATYQPIDTTSGASVPTEQWYAGEVFLDNALNEYENPWIFPRNDPRLFINPMDVSQAVDNPLKYPLRDLWALARAETVTPGVTLTQQRAVAALRHANSFCVQFGPDGRTSNTFRIGSNEEANALLEHPGLPLDAELPPTDPYYQTTFDSPRHFDPEAIPVSMPLAPTLNPEVVLRSVNQLAIVEINAFTAGTGVSQPWRLHPATSRAPWPDDYIDDAGAPIPHDDDALNDIVLRVGQWIDRNAEIIDFNRYTGEAIRR